MGPHKVATQDQREEGFRASGRSYSAMWDEMANKDPRMPQSAATQALCAHIEAMAVAWRKQKEEWVFRFELEAVIEASEMRENELAQVRAWAERVSERLDELEED